MDAPPHGRDTAPEHDRKFVMALARGLEVLRAFRARDGLLGNTEIAERTGLPKPTVTRLTYTLTRLGYLVHVARFNKYQLAPAAMALGYTALAHIGIRHIARPHMQALADHAGGAVALGSRDRLSVIYVQHCVASTNLSTRLDVGSRIPIATTAIGRALISVMSKEEREELSDRLAERAGGDWARISEGIERAMADVRKRGFTVSFGDWLEDVNGVAAPIIMPDGSGVYAFSCGALSSDISGDRLVGEVAPRLLDLVHAVEAMLGGHASGLDDADGYGLPVFQGARRGAPEGDGRRRRDRTVTSRQPE